MCSVLPYICIHQGSKSSLGTVLNFFYLNTHVAVSVDCCKKLTRGHRILVFVDTYSTTNRIP